MDNLDVAKKEDLYEIYKNEICPLDVAERKADKFEAEKEEWEKKYKELDNDLKAELRDPNGTIWEHAKRLQDECDRLNKGVKRILRFVELRRKSECELIFEIRALLRGGQDG